MNFGFDLSSVPLRSADLLTPGTMLYVASYRSRSLHFSPVALNKKTLIAAAIMLRLPQRIASDLTLEMFTINANTPGTMTLAVKVLLSSTILLEVQQLPGWFQHEPGERLFRQLPIRCDFKANMSLQEVPLKQVIGNIRTTSSKETRTRACSHCCADTREQGFGVVGLLQ